MGTVIDTHCQYASVQVCDCASVPVWHFASLPVWHCACVPPLCRWHCTSSVPMAVYQQCANGSVPVGTVMDAPYLFPPPLPTPPIGFEPLPVPTSSKGNHLSLEYFNIDTWSSLTWYILSLKKCLHISILHFKKSCNNFGDFFA